MKMKMFKRGLLIGVLLFSVFSLVFSPYHELKDQFIEAAPWVVTGMIVSELCFILGLTVMAIGVGSKVRNPLRLRREIKTILISGVTTQIFWIGFWINAVGAVGTAVCGIAGIVLVLPIGSWGLMVLPLLDVAATITLRVWAVKHRPNPVQE